MFVVIEDFSHHPGAQNIMHGVIVAGSGVIFETEDQARDYIDFLYEVYGPNGRKVKELI